LKVIAVSPKIELYKLVYSLVKSKGKKSVAFINLGYVSKNGCEWDSNLLAANGIRAHAHNNQRGALESRSHN